MASDPSTPKAGWEVKTLGEVLSFEYGKPLPKEKRHESGAYPVFGANGIKARSDEYYHDKPSIVVGRKGSAGEVNLTGGPFWPLDVTYFVKFDDSRYNLKFLFNLLTSLNLPSLAKGVKPGINRNEVHALQSKFPPLAEQERIVGILDEAFEGIAAATAQAEKNLHNARELFQSVLQSTFSQKGEDWVETTIGEVCTLKSGMTINKDLEKPTGEIPYLKVADMNILGNERVVISSSRFLDRNEIRDTAVFPVGTTIFPKRGGAIATNKKRLTAVPICADLNIMGVIPSERLDPSFLYLYFINVDMRELGSGTTIPQINNYDIDPLTISHPTNLPTQQAIVEKLDALSEETKALEAIYERKQSALAELKQSLLQKAFAGEL